MAGQPFFAEGAWLRRSRFMRWAMALKSVTVRQIQQLDDIAIRKIGIPSVVLMENAGRSVAEEACKHLKRHPTKRISVLCGTGNNGGDGLVVSRYLINAGMKPKIFLMGDPHDLKSDAALQYRILQNLRYPVKPLSQSNQHYQKSIQQSDFIVDAIFGVGLNREIGYPHRSLIETINRAGKFVICVDIPSGLDGTSGVIYGVCVKATLTVTFSFAKRGFFFNQGPAYVGKVIVKDIGIPRELMQRI